MSGVALIPVSARWVFPTAVVATLAGAWWLRHINSRAVRVWRPGGGRFLRTGRLVTRVVGSGERVFVLLHGLVSSGETFGAAYDRLADQGTLVIPDRIQPEHGSRTGRFRSEASSSRAR